MHGASAPHSHICNRLSSVAAATGCALLQLQQAMLCCSCNRLCSVAAATGCATGVALLQLALLTLIYMYIHIRALYIYVEL